MTYGEAIDYLYALPVFDHTGGGAYKPGPENMLALEAAAGDPRRRFASVHVAGTNGKGSVSHMVAAVLAEAGYRTGLFTSPHLKDFRERIRIDGGMIPEEAVVAWVERYRAEIDRVQPSFFEAATAMAFDYFARKSVDVAVIEVGMGGSLDSTNVIRPLVSVITNVSRDHAQFLGGTLEKIAAEKAGIIKDDTPVVVGESRLETQLVFIEQAKEHHAPLLFADQLYRVVGVHEEENLQTFEVENRLDGERFSLAIDLAGDYQRHNILTALATLDVLNGEGGLAIPRGAVRRGMAGAAAGTGLRGRWQVVGRRPLVVADIGHNEAALAETVRQLTALPHENLYMVLGFAADKEVDSILELLPRDARYLFTQAAIPRAMDAGELTRRAAAHGLSGETIPGVATAVCRARELAGPDDVIYVGGSNFVVAEL